MKHNNSATGFFLCASIILGAVFSVSCKDGFLHGALYTNTLTISAAGKSGTLLWLDDNSTVRRMDFIAESAESTEVDSVAITVSKGFVTPVLLFCDDAEHPEGFVYPFSDTFTEAGGFAAHILYRLVQESAGRAKNETRLFCGHFNWKKLEEEAAKLADPWGCDQTLILESIADGSFTPHVLKL